MKASGLSYSMHSAGTTVGMSLPSSYRFPRRMIRGYGYIPASHQFLWLSLSELRVKNVGWQNHVFWQFTPEMEEECSIFDIVRTVYMICSNTLCIEGPWDAVTKLIGQAHTLVHQNGVVRVQTDIRIGTRYDFPS